MRGGGPEDTTQTKHYFTTSDGEFAEVPTIEEIIEDYDGDKTPYSFSSNADNNENKKHRINKKEHEGLIDWAINDYEKLQKKDEEVKKNPWVLGGLILVATSVIGGIYLNKSLKH